jgi:hypothetical protein
MFDQVCRRYVSSLLLLLVVLSAASCASAKGQLAPRIQVVQPDRLEVARYGKLEFTVALEAVYDNPYDVRQVGLAAVFTGPDGREWTVPGFWDGEEAWRVRFAPSVVGEWRYSLYVRDRQGESDLFRQIVALEDSALVVATHDPVVDDFATAVYELDDGQLTRSSQPREASDG